MGLFGFGKKNKGPMTPEQLYKKGLKEKKHYNYTAALPLLEQAAEAGIVDAQFLCGDMYLWGDGTPLRERDIEKSLFWLEMASEQGHARASYMLRLIYEEGYGVERDHDKSVYWLKLAAAQGNPDAKKELDDFTVEEKREAELRARQNVEYCHDLPPDVKLGNPLAMFRYGNRYYRGEGVAQDYVQALYWFERAAEQGFANAQYNCGIIYNMGKGVKENKKKAFDWFKKAAEQGHPNAQHNLGVMCNRGEGTFENMERSFYWFKKAAEQGFAMSQYNLGIMYENGEGTDHDRNEARHWLRLAAIQSKDEKTQKLAEEALKEL